MQQTKSYKWEQNKQKVIFNLIRYNSIDDPSFKQANNSAIALYMNVLEKNNITVTFRRSRGKDIDAACGQLANKNQ